MSEQNKYEEEWRSQMNDLPLPDVEGAWQHMQRKLDEEDKRRRMLPPFVLNCLGVVLVLTLLGGAWYLLGEQNLSSWPTTAQKAAQHTTVQTKHPESERASPLTERTITNGEKDEATSHSSTSENGTAISSSDDNSPAVQKEMPVASPGKQPAEIVADKKGAATVVKRKPADAAPLPAFVARKNRKNQTAGQTDANLHAEQQKELPAVTTPPGTNRAATTGKEERKPVAPASAETIAQKEDSSHANPALQTKSGDSLKAGSTDSARVKPPEKQDKRQKKIYFTAGLGLQQIIPLDGQSSVPYNKEGRTASLSDYLPSVWVRMHRGKWFLQGEFRYGAPQSVKEISFAQRTKFDNSTGDLSVTKTVLRKTYYHQLPLTLNYHVHKNISIGVGAMYSHFYGAVTQQEIRTQNVLTGQESFKSTIVPVRSFNDSFLYKTQMHLLLQADYHWRRFNLGLRYATDLQPYIKYTMPDGTIRTEKNHSLQFFLRYRLFPFKKL